MRDDTPDDLVHDLFARGDVPRASARPRGDRLAGDDQRDDARRRSPRSTASTTTRATSWSRPPATSSTRRVVELVEQVPADDVRRPAAARRVARRRPAPKPLAVLERDTEQAHVVLGMRALRTDDPDRYALGVLNQALGGGMSSRLFQEVREKRGLAYSVYSYRAAYEETGALAVSAGTGPERLDEPARRGRPRARPARRRPRAHRPRARRGQGPPHGLAGAVARELQLSRMHRLGRSEMTLGEVPSLDELVAEVEPGRAPTTSPA